MEPRFAPAYESMGVDVIDRWRRFWFAESSATNLAVCRVLFYAGVLLFYLLEDFTAWGSVSQAFWIPLPLFSVLHLKPLAPASLAMLQAIWWIALAMSAVGLLTRLSMATSFALGAYLLGLPHNFGQTYHFDALLVIAMGVLMCSSAGDALSIDAWRGGHAPPPKSGEYTWPIKMIWVAMSLVFFAAGVAKIRYGGLEWILSSHLSILLMRALYHVSDADPVTTAGLWIARQHGLSRLLAAAALTIEVGFPLALVSRRARVVFVPAAFAMLIGIRMLMGPTFGGFLIANVFWVPWDAVGARVAAWGSRRNRVGLMYDGRVYRNVAEHPGRAVCAIDSVPREITPSPHD